MVFTSFLREAFLLRYEAFSSIFRAEIITNFSTRFDNAISYLFFFFITLFFFAGLRLRAKRNCFSSSKSHVIFSGHGPREKKKCIMPIAKNMRSHESRDVNFENPQYLLLGEFSFLFFAVKCLEKFWYLCELRSSMNFLIFNYFLPPFHEFTVI